MFNTFLHSRLASVGLASVIAVSVLGTAGIAMAEGGSSNDTPGATSQATPGAGKHDGKGILKGLMQDIIAKSALSKDVFQQGFKDGKTINDILGTNAASVKAQVQTDAEARIADAVLKGTITQDQATRANEKLPTLLDKMFSSTPKPHEGKGGPGDQGGNGRHLGAIAKDAITTVAGVLHIDEATLKADLKSGQTIAQVAGPKTQDVINALNAKADAAIDKAVTGGKIKAENADAAKTKAHEHVTNFVNNGRPHHGDKSKTN
jgi:hypothetical protein